MKRLADFALLSLFVLLAGCGGGQEGTEGAGGGITNPPPPPALVYTGLHTFTGGTDGKNPSAGLVRDAAGNLYGTTVEGGDLTCPDDINGCGIVFKMDFTGALTTLHVFAGGPTDGANPQGLIRDASGNLYGTTLGGGNRSCTQGCGTVFKLDATGSETVLYQFAGGAAGARPESLVRDGAGNLYGTTVEDGDPDCPDRGGLGCGTIFKLDSGGAFTTLHVFAGGATDGAVPNSGLIRDAVGNFYGSSHFGGDHQYGTVFKLDATGSESVLHHFTGEDGAYPEGFLVADEAGNLYGSTRFGGNLDCSADFFGCGTIFKLDPDGVLTTLRVFGERRNDLSFPSPDLIRDAAGNLYGTAHGGAHGFGAVFKLSATGGTTVVFSFTGAEEGIGQRLRITDSVGNFYGAAFSGGDTTCDPTNGGCGVVFKIGPP
jgi:uncharacterized repeat protein (TIGR03803 family)